jgi:hypothetical protein
MTKYKVAIALSCGAGFTSLVLLMLNLSSVSALSTLLTAFLLPGGIPADLVLKPKEFSPPFVIFAANALVYSGVAYAGISVFCRSIVVEKMRLAALRLLPPAVILVGLTCIPVLNPLWPRGMAELTKQEKDLQAALPMGVGLERARAVLRSKGIQFQETTEISQAVLLDRQDKSITAAAGDRVISARVETDAGQFLCGYDMEVVLLFGPDEKLKDQYIHRLRLCP